MRKIFIYLIFVYSNAIFSQNDSIILDLQSSNFHFYTIDKLHNIYVKNDAYALQKYNEHLVLEYSYNNFKNGKIKVLDVSNPFQIMLFSNETNRIIYLDNKLNVNIIYNLLDWNLNNIALACRANDNFIWLFDNDDFRLLLVNEEGKTYLKSEELFNYITNTPSLMFFQDNILYIYDETKGLIMFDNNGIYIKSIPIFNSKIQQIIGKKIIYIKENKLYIYDTESFENSEKDINCDKIWFSEFYTLYNTNNQIVKIKHQH